MGLREPGQVGNEAAISGSFQVRRASHRGPTFAGRNLRGPPFDRYPVRKNLGRLAARRTAHAKS